MALIPKTVTYYPQLVEPNSAHQMYHYLVTNVPWGAGIRSRFHGETRKAYAVNPGQETGSVDRLLSGLVRQVVEAIPWVGSFSLPDGRCCRPYEIGGIYVNWYRTGKDFAPTHSHEGTAQLVISLGQTRTLQVNSKKYVLGSGDVIVFGEAPHSLLREPDLVGDATGRISIAVFLIPVQHLVT